MSSSSVFANLLSAKPTWSELRDFLRSEEGGRVSVYEVPGTVLATLRYVKDESIMDIEHVGAFRSVVWNTETNRPVSVTPYKSANGEGLPTGLTAESGVTVEEFADGVLIGQFWDSSTESWRIHTRTMLDGVCRYYSKTKTFAAMFEEAAVATFGSTIPFAFLDADPAHHTDHRNLCFSWILAHPENRIVCPVQKPRLTLVATYRLEPETGLVTIAAPPVPFSTKCPRRYYTKSQNVAAGMLDVQGVMSYAQVAATLPVPADLNSTLALLVANTGSLSSQGFVVKSDSEPFRRWKVRSPTYNTVRHLRGNSPRLDFQWIDYWSKGTLATYLQHYPEERLASQAVVDRWMTASKNVFKWYCDVFKARAVSSADIPRKYRPLVYGLHDLYHSLKPLGKPLDWRAAVGWLNDRDTAQKLFIINWDLRQENSTNYSVAATV